ncbi:hypothetical protein FRB93_010948 [Tulasnella sp. JGI-2019a]|nr:hypothetical protein FRB93_010948 [Tulasnella sp. JGI-2019a]
MRQFIANLQSRQASRITPLTSEHRRRTSPMDHTFSASVCNNIVVDISIPEPTKSYGVGGHYDLFQGYNGETGAKLAMKRIRVSGPVGEFEAATTVKRRISREAIIWRSLCHNNILTFLGVANVADATYLVSPWMELRDLYSFVTSRLEFLQWDQGNQGELDHRVACYRRFKEQDPVNIIMER